MNNPAGSTTVTPRPTPLSWTQVQSSDRCGSDHQELRRPVEYGSDVEFAPVAHSRRDPLGVVRTLLDVGEWNFAAIRLHDVLTSALPAIWPEFHRAQVYRLTGEVLDALSRNHERLQMIELERALDIWSRKRLPVRSPQITGLTVIAANPLLEQQESVEDGVVPPRIPSDDANGEAGEIGDVTKIFSLSSLAMPDESAPSRLSGDE